MVISLGWAASYKQTGRIGAGIEMELKDFKGDYVNRE